MGDGFTVIWIVWLRSCLKMLAVLLIGPVRLIPLLNFQGARCPLTLGLFNR